MAGLVLVRLLAAAGCASSRPGPKKPDKLTQELLTEPKEVLFEKGKALIAKKKYEDGRKYLNHVFETYPNEPLGREALLLVADSYFKQKSDDRVHRGALPLPRLPQPVPRRAAARLRPLPVRALLRQGAREAGPGPDRDAGGASSSTGRSSASSPTRATRAPRGSGSGSSPTCWRSTTSAVGYFYLRKGSTAAALSRFTSLGAAVSRLRRPRTSSTTTRAMALDRLGPEGRGAAATSPRSWRSSPRAITPRRRVESRAGTLEGPPATAATVDTKPQSQ